MKLVNISSKIISIGDKVVMPDGDIPCNKTVAELPAVKAFVKKGLLRIDDGDDKAKAEAEAKAKAEAEAKAKAEAEAKAAAEKEAAEKAEAEKKAAAEAKKKAEAEAKAAKASK